ncbi:MAG TPA: PKD domain-containing protein, partial [bacterium]
QAHADVWKPDMVGTDRSVVDKRIDPFEGHWSFHGVHAQNYHIFTPAEGKDWTLAWGSATWIKNLPFSNAACSFHFKSGESGKLVLEFWITPFDYAGPEGPERSVESTLWENKVIGLSWAVIDYDDANSAGNNGFWNLSRKHTMYGDASELVAFRLMPLEPSYRKPIEAYWSFKIMDMDRRLVAFKDMSVGEVKSWKWEFGDGAVSTEQHPMHVYARAGSYTVVLYVEGPGGRSRRAKVWEVNLK